MHVFTSFQLQLRPAIAHCRAMALHGYASQFKWFVRSTDISLSV